jgi:hypothetical protein
MQVTRENREEILTRWAETLETTTVRQTSTFLCVVGPNGEKEQCCLGVLHELLYPDTWIPADNVKPIAMEYLAEGWQIMATPDKQYQVLSSDVEKILGIDQSLYTHLNDLERRTFGEIAQHVRARLVHSAERPCDTP